MHIPRQSGILLHPTSLPGRYGVGQLGQAARDFVDFLAASQQKLWQVLPLNPTGYTNCPYSATSAFAGNPYLIDLETLVADGLLLAEELAGCEAPENGRADFGHVYQQQSRLLWQAYARRAGLAAEMQAFATEHAYWLEDYARFAAIKEAQGGRPWFDWPEALRRREPEALAAWCQDNAAAVDFQRFVQFLFFRQWGALKAYAAAHGIAVISDIPLYVAHDSADVWAHPEIFCMDSALNPTAKAGVPPDVFSATGQLWGNPVYNWPALQASGFRWWLERIRINLLQGDILRFDHFRALESFWSVPWDHDSAMNGSWVPVPGDEFFAAIRQTFGTPVLVAEDLGIITPEVEALRDRHELLSMKILQFAFENPEPDNAFMPHTYPEGAIVYTSSPDSDTSRGWLDNVDGASRQRALDYLQTSPENFTWAMLAAAWGSKAVLAVAPLQDVFGLGSGARMNLPGTAHGNWEWRYRAEDLKFATQCVLRDLTQRTGR